MEAHVLGLLAEPQPAGIGAADPSEVVGAEAENRAVIDHAAGVVAHGGVDDLSDGQFADIAGQAGLEEQFGIRAGHLVLAQRREVDDPGLFPDSPVLVNGAVVGVVVGQPVAGVFGEVSGELGGSGVEARLLGEFGCGIGAHAEGRRFLEGVGRRVDANVDVGGLPPVGGVDVARAGRRHADQVGKGTEEDVVAGSRPRLLEVELVRVVEVGVVKEVDGLPAPAGGDSVRLKGLVEVVAAVDVAWVAHVLVVLGIAGSVEIGDNVVIGGQAGIVGHIKIGNNVIIAGKSGVTKNILNNAKVSGFPAVDIVKWKKNIIKQYR